MSFNACQFLQSHRSTASPSDSVSGGSLQKVHRDDLGGTAGSSRQSHGHGRSAAATSVHRGKLLLMANCQIYFVKTLFPRMHHSCVFF